MPLPLALVTGASSGIGLELATLLARDRHDLVVVGRTAESLERVAAGLREELHVEVAVVVQDLAAPDAHRAVARELARRALANIDVLVNNAGFGVYGLFAETPLEKELEMLRVNVAAPTALTKLVLPGMLARRRGRILNVASTAAFQPGPLMAAYYASKAYVLSFSEAIANEVAGSGVTVTALCPGPTITEFQKKAGVESTRLFTGPLVSDARRVALAGYRGMMRGRRVVIPGIGNFLLAEAVRVSPRRMVTAIARRIQESRS
jgi:short-subunit dehydrogenase